MFPSYLFIVGTQQIVLGNIIVLVAVLCCVGCAWFCFIVLGWWCLVGSALLVVLCWLCFCAILAVLACALLVMLG